MNRYTNAKLVDIHFIYDLVNGNGNVATWLYGKDIQRCGNRIIKRSLGCIRTWRLVHGEGYFISLLPPIGKPIEAFPDPPPGDALCKGYRLPLGVKSFFICPCSLFAAPAHLLDSWGISLLQLFEQQGLVCETITRKGQMDLVLAFLLQGDWKQHQQQHRTWRSMDLSES
ncbi:uncharacterized protein TNCV_314981 [Trichonephila clavipes]|nr:uncharacterized protein TNCV_314981 [Trichonephila clavipes]